MRKTILKLGGLAIGLAFMCATATAHHSFDIEFDSKKVATITGVVTKFDWANPHAYIHMESKDANGVAKSFRVELGPPYSLTRGGWKRDTIKIGDKITIEGAALARDGGPSAGALPTTFLTEAPALKAGQKLPLR